MLAMAGGRQKSSHRAGGHSAGGNRAHRRGLPFPHNRANRIAASGHGFDKRTRTYPLHLDAIHADWQCYIGWLICQNENGGRYGRSVHPHEADADWCVAADRADMRVHGQRSSPDQGWTVDIERDGRKSILSKHGSVLSVTDRCAPGCTWAERG